MMKVIIISFILLLSWTYSFAQNSNEQLDKLQKLQTIVRELEQEMNDDKQELSEIEAIRLIKYQRDSLNVLVELLKAELLLYEGKLTQKTINLLTSRNELKVPITDTLISLAPGNNLSTESNNGYYVVLESERTMISAEDRSQAFQKKYPNYHFKVIANQRKTWYHICFSDKGDISNIGKRVFKARKMGFTDAWWIRL